MVRTVALVFFLLQALLCSAEAGDGVLLSNITIEENPRESRIVLSLSDLSAHRMVTSGQRVDIFLKNTSASAQVDLPDTGRFIRTLLGQNKDELMVSFLMRSVPGEVKVLTQKVPAALVLTIDWGKGKPLVRPVIVTGKNSSLSIQSGDLPWYPKSLNEKAWTSFFHSYETPLQIFIPLTCTLVELAQIVPASSDDQALHPGLKSALMAIAENNWEKILIALRRISETELDQRNHDAFLVIFGEALSRFGEVEEASRVLAQFLDTSENSALQARARYLWAYALAVSGKPFEAGYQISKILSADVPGLYSIYAGLLQAEIHISTGQLALALEILQKAPSLRRGQGFMDVWNRRLADTLAALGKHERAVVLYREISDWNIMRGLYPFSLAHFAESLYRTGEYAYSKKYFDVLSVTLKDRTGDALATFGSARAQMRMGKMIIALGRLSDLRRSFPGTEEAFRAWLKMLDARMQEKGQEFGIPMAGQYSEIAKSTASRELREEATFKEALALFIGGDRKGSVRKLHGFLRQFSRGPLQPTAEGLFVDLLPRVIEELLKSGQDVQAVVLVEQNRDYLVATPLSTDLLLGLGNAFTNLGLLERATKIFFFMLDSWAGRPEEAMLYPLLCNTLFEQGEYAKAAEYAERYLDRFSGGESEQELFLLRMEALWHSGQLEEADAMLKTRKIQGSPEVNILATRIFWKLGEFEKVMRVPDLPEPGPEDSGTTQALALKAEALFLSGKNHQALPIYQELFDVAEMADLALYRTAQIRLRTGEKETALNLFKRLVEEGINPYWKKMAGVFLASE